MLELICSRGWLVTTGANLIVEDHSSNCFQTEPSRDFFGRALHLAFACCYSNYYIHQGPSSCRRPCVWLFLAKLPFICVPRSIKPIIDLAYLWRKTNVSECDFQTGLIVAQLTKILAHMRNVHLRAANLAIEFNIPASQGRVATAHQALPDIVEAMVDMVHIVSEWTPLA